MERQYWNKEHIAELLRAAYFEKKWPRRKQPHVLVLGIGQFGGGEGVIRFFSHLNWKVTARDSKPKNEFGRIRRALPSKNIIWKFGELKTDKFFRYDLVIRNPAIPLEHPYVQRMLRNNVRVVSDADVFLKVFPRGQIIGVTGTKGKTTTTLLTAHLLNEKFKTFAVGIPGVSFFSPLWSKERSDYYVAEFSSYDLELIGSSPHIAILTSFASDHIDRHGSFEKYARAKSHLFRHQIKNDLYFIPQKFAQEHLFKFSEFARKKVFPLRPRIRTQLNWSIYPSVAAVAVEVARTLGISEAHIKKGLASFRGAPGRRQLVLSRRGIIAINDTTATAPIAAEKTIHDARLTFGGKHVIGILGGVNKNFRDADIRAVGDSLKHIKQVFIIPGSFSDKLARVLKQLNVNAEFVETLEDAVKKSVQIAGKKDVIILTPGASSFNLFKNEFDRGEQYAELMLHYL